MRAEFILATSEIDQFVAESCRQVATTLLEFLATQEETAENTDAKEPTGEYVHFPKEALQGLIEGLQHSADYLDLSVQMQTSHSEILQTVVTKSSDSEAD